MTRVAFKMKLLPGARSEYQRRHEAIWPELVALIRQAGVSEYSIFLDEETDVLFAVQKKQDAGQGSQDLGNHPVVRRWWAYMADLMETHPDDSPVSVPLTEVFYL